jgi:alkylation response protein AidB-like acyl-CoA dehydrogenase
MQFQLSSEQQALAEATAGLLNTCATTHRQAAVDGETTFDLGCWRRSSDELGLAGIAVPEEHGGADGSLLDAAVVMEAAGFAVSILPLWTSLGAGRILVGLADPALAGELLTEVAAGVVVPGWIGLSASQVVEATGSDHGGHVLNGSAAHVVGGAWMDQLLVIARTDRGSGLFHIPADADGVTVTPERAVDPTRQLVSVSFNDTPGTQLSSSPIDAASLAKVRAEIGILLAAEQVGTAQGALDMAVEYAKTRQQFGRPIGSFQALKHLLADSYVDVATARDVMRYGAWALSANLEGPDHIGHLTRASVTPRVMRVCANNLQVHGGVGYTWEHDAHLFYKRSLSAAHLLHEPDLDLDIIADDIGLGEVLPESLST